MERTLCSVKNLVADILVVDSDSKDQTIAIAKAAGARVMTHKWQGFGPQKRFAEEKCKHQWVLNLDADEVLSPALADEIRQLFTNGTPKCAGYRFHQVTVYPHQDRPRLWADFHNYIRLYDRSKIRFANSPSHDAVEAKGQNIGQLQEVALHYSWRSLSHLANKYERYTDLQAATLSHKAWPILLLRLLSEFPLHFLKIYLLRRHFSGGWHGIQVAGIIAWVRWRRIAKLIRAKCLAGRPLTPA